MRISTNKLATECPMQKSPQNRTTLLNSVNLRHKTTTEDDRAPASATVVDNGLLKSSMQCQAMTKLTKTRCTWYASVFISSVLQYGVHRSCKCLSPVDILLL